MRLTVYTDYALRLLMYLAVHVEPRPTVAEVATSYGISRNHLMKVVYDLSLAGYVATTRGKKGGLRLGRPAAEIGLGEVVRHTEPDMALVPCAAPEGAPCAIAPACRLKGALFRAQAAFLEVLDGYTLADLVENRAVLGGLLERHAASDRDAVALAER
jgi:Rrf2 family nitric oxide-sensitive transcriptional repressor